MRVEVEFTSRARVMLVRLLAARLAHPGDAYPFAAVYVEEAEQVLTASRG